MSKEPTINFSAVPTAVCDSLAATVLAEVKRFKAQPGGREKLQKAAEEFYQRRDAAKRKEQTE